MSVRGWRRITLDIHVENFAATGLVAFRGAGEGIIAAQEDIGNISWRKHGCLLVDKDLCILIWLVDSP